MQANGHGLQTLFLELVLGLWANAFATTAGMAAYHPAAGRAAAEIRS